MGDLSKRLSTKEFRCKCPDCQTAQVKPVINMTLVVLIEMIHDHFSSYFNAKVKIILNSANRCKKHNIAVGGKPDSRHLVPDHGDAADIIVYVLNEHGHWQAIDPRVVYDFINDTFTQSFGCHAYQQGEFTHIDARPIRARW